MKNIYDVFFSMKLHGGWSFIEAYNLPVGLRDYYFKKLIEHYEKQNKEYDKLRK